MVAPVIAAVLSTLAANGLNLLASAVTAKGKEVIEEKLGVDITAEMQTPEGLLKLKQLEVDNEQFLISAAIENRKIDLEVYREDNKNTDSARNMNSNIQMSAEASYIAKVLPYILDSGVFILTFGLVYLLFFKKVAVENEKLLYMALGACLTWCGTILNFHRGSSRSSQTKDETISTLSRS